MLHCSLIYRPTLLAYVTLCRDLLFTLPWANATALSWLPDDTKHTSAPLLPSLLVFRNLTHDHLYIPVHQNDDLLAVAASQPCCSARFYDTTVFQSVPDAGFQRTLPTTSSVIIGSASTGTRRSSGGCLSMPNLTIFCALVMPLRLIHTIFHVTNGLVRVQHGKRAKVVMPMQRDLDLIQRPPE